MKKLVIFDLDGTLLNTIADLAHSTNYALNKLGYPTHEIEKYNFIMPMTAALIPVFRNYSHTYRMQVFKLLWLPTNIRQPPKS